MDGVCLLCLQSGRARESQRHSPTPEYGSPSLAMSYQTLGRKESDSDELIRKTYYKRAKEVHPDALRGKDISEEEIKLKTQEFQELQAAYNRIMSVRKKRKNP